MFDNIPSAAAFRVPELSFRVSSLGEEFKKQAAAFELALRNLRLRLDHLTQVLCTPDPEFQEFWHAIQEIGERDPEAAKVLGDCTLRELWPLRRCIRPPPRPRGRPQGHTSAIQVGLKLIESGDCPADAARKTISPQTRPRSRAIYLGRTAKDDAVKK